MSMSTTSGAVAATAAVPLAANTALLGLRDLGRLRPGQTVLINGAAGGVGTFAVQIAKALGAEVTAVCSARNADLVRRIGADHVVDYTSADFTTGAQRYDLLLDLVANRSLAHCRRTLTPLGTLVLSGGGGGRWFGPVGLIVRARVVSPFVRQGLRALAVTPRRENLLALTELIEAGQLTPVIDRTYPLADAPAAIRYLEGRHARAKVVITIAEDTK
jgi:NADPH:quinone reductase-like Zn-dependent oxidoreductase